MKASHKLAEQMYAKTSAAGGPGPERQGARAPKGRKSPKKRWWRQSSKK